MSEAAVGTESNAPEQVDVAVEQAFATINKSRLDEANSIITKYAAFGFGGGVIPFPMMDIAAVAGIQLKMLSELSSLYEVEFVENWGKSSLSAVVGGAMPHLIAVGTVGSLIKAIPLVGSAIGFATVPLLAAATTYAVGKVFIQHFESGGNFLDFDAVAARSYFREQFAKAKEQFQKQTERLKKRPCEAENAPPAEAGVEAAAETVAESNAPAEAVGEEDLTNVTAVHLRRSAKRDAEV